MKTQMAAYLKYAAKAVLAFLALLLTNVFTRLITNGEPIPADTKGWLVFGITTLGGTWLVWQKTNGPKPTGKHAADE